ncbi:MAG: hypothetical protein MJA30_32990 [Cytophagales bacterium]|nr:hypothetical protein [Cytophagales bacterium]
MKVSPPNQLIVRFKDEIGHAQAGVLPDSHPNQQDTMRREMTWGNLMAAGAGVEHLFGYKYSHNDLNCEDWHIRDRVWKMTSCATNFFQKLPLERMTPDNDPVSAKEAYCLAAPGDTYVVYLKSGGETTLDLTDVSGKFPVKCVDPGNGGVLQKGSITSVKGGSIRALGAPPREDSADWAILVGENKVWVGYH